MTRGSDIRAVDATVTFRSVTFTAPLNLSSGSIRGLTEATVQVTAETRRGRRGWGTGVVLLSHPWACKPRPGVSGDDPAELDRRMRALVTAAAAGLAGAGYGDPLQLAARMRHAATAPGLPALAAQVCLAPVDAAVHDAWAMAAGRSAYRMYDAGWLNQDLGAYLGPAFRGRYPAHYLRRRPHRRLPYQHVVGLADPVTRLRQEAGGARWFKVKISGAGAAGDAARIVQVAHAAGPGARLCLDPNEGFAHPSGLHDVLGRLPAAVRSRISYAEQPIGRDAPGGADLTALATHLPILIDEGCTDAADLDRHAADGWSGVAVKTGRGGHSQALLGYCWARHHGRFVTVQDLTSTGGALTHMAALASWLDCSVPCLEANSLQYCPHANTGTAAALRVEAGMISLAALPRRGIR
ncbi:enolase C-terminal domain-like protein [Dactylosporangium sp. CA-233914]|uniref:enolase C-terminal domain-like protein n=1 Tax=Dactylosporangium sp. CA-233914 TaxID=3239934 RepID=UPI003D94B5F5